MSNTSKTKTAIPSIQSLEKDFGQKFAYPASTKTYLQGSRPDIKAPIRMIEQQPTRVGEQLVANPPVPVYDTSGPYSDPDILINLEKGLPKLRKEWIEQRNDTELLSGPSSEYGVARSQDPQTANLRFAHIAAPRVAKAGKNVSQMYYARQGIVTPEMEYVALRESMGLEQLRKNPEYKQLLKQHPGKSYGANLPEIVTR
ncbi:hypothetical protein M2131_000254 [Polynucleobacter sphagniphilus]|nr:hypothetical protein [Polynucleobacter sphagniphilus]